MRWREDESSSSCQAQEIPALSWVGGSQTPALVPSHLWLEVANPALPTLNSLFIFKRTKRGSVGDVLPHPGSSCHCWVTAERQSQWSVDAQHCRGHTVVQSWTKCSITSKCHQPHENTRPVVGLAGEEVRTPWVTCSQELAWDSGPGQAPHPCVLGSHSAHEVLLTSPHVPIRGRPTE